jgi:tetratricopeptide (TPR) repeat protein
MRKSKWLLADLWLLVSTLGFSQSKLVPVYPASTPELVFLEAEYAVSTNFSKEPILNYGCSSSRTLQLNRTLPLFGNAPFYAEFVFFIQEEGTYEIWYGGSPPGPKDDLLPSYASPFNLRIDGTESTPVYREDVHVVENYTPAYYWNVLKRKVTLKPGVHTVRVEITEKRRFDNRYFFYLDALFFRKEGSEARPKSALAKFPQDLQNRRIDNPFGTIQEYEEILRKDQKDIRNYIYLSLIYSLVGDYSNALRVLRRGYALEPKNQTILLLLAKNRIWKGDFPEGLAGYRAYLTEYPDNLEAWKEAGKVAAWVGKYAESERFYLDALGKFPDDPSLLVNLGFTYLWQSDNQRAERLFQEALEKSLDSPEKLKLLAEIYKINGYADRAIPIYRKGTETYPQELEFHLLLADTLIRMGKEEEAGKVYASIEEKYESSEQLTAYLSLAKQQAEMRNKVIQEYQQKLEMDPDNLSLRETLVEAYFWNGLKEKAIQESYIILATHSFRQLKEFDTAKKDLLSLVDSLYLYSTYFRDVVGRATSLRGEGNAALSSYTDALKEASRFEEQLRVAAERGQTVPTPEKGDPRQILRIEEEKVARVTESIAEFLNRFESNDNRYRELDSKVPEVLEQEKTSLEEFSRLTLPLNWKWDRQFYVDELSSLVSVVPVLAAHTLGRIQQITGALPEAERLYRKALEAPKPQEVTSYALWETLLWKEDREARKSLLGSPATESIKRYTNLTDTMEQLDTELYREQPRTPVFTEQVPDRLRELLPRLETVRATAASRLGELEKTLQTLRYFLAKGLERSFFDLQEKTLLLRYELGDYLLSSRRLVEATRQLRHVLAMDPANLNALYKLGVVRQLYGDWYEAMEFYRRVYGIDPTFERAVSYHNQLARMHPNLLEVEAKTFADTSRITTTAEGSYTHAFGSTTALKTLFRTESLRMYKQNPWSTASTHQLHTLIASLPFSFYKLAVGFTPRLGLDVASSAYDNPGGYTDTDTPGLPWFISTYKAFPNLGVDARISVKDFTFLPSYTYSRERDTFIPGRPNVAKNQVELTLQKPFTFDARYGLTQIYSRTYGSLSILSDGNRKGTALQDTSLYFHVADAPWTTLGLSTVLVFEHAEKHPDPERYYAPDGVFVVKAGPLGSTYISLGEGRVLGFVLQTLTGLYREKSLSSSPENKFYIEGILRTELTLDSTVLYCSVYGSGAFPGSKPDYWSMQVQLGVSQKLQRLLAP